jgi:protocatechuate 3,4-dioxygenase beta subunit
MSLSIGGTVSDPTGAAVSGAAVDLMTARAVARSATTNTQGHYRFENLEPGETRSVSRRVAFSASSIPFV